MTRRERRETEIEALVTRLRGEADVHEDLSLLSEVRVPATDGAFPTEGAVPHLEGPPGTPPPEGERDDDEEVDESVLDGPPRPRPGGRAPIPG